MSLVDQYDDRVFSNGRVMGGKYNEMSGKTDYFDVSPFTRKAGAGIGLDPDVVIYMGKAAQGMPQDEGMDRRIAEGMLNAIARTLEYVPGRDDSSPRTLEYVPGRDDSGVELLAGNPSFDITGRSGDARRKRRDLTPGDVNRLMNAYPDDAEKIRKMYLPGAVLPRV